MFEILHSGGNAHDATMLMIRLAVGTFFIISGYHKLFNKQRHESMRKTLVDDGVKFVGFNQWFVPSVEFLGGLAVFVGLFTAIAALGLIVICFVATCVDGFKRIKAWNPIDIADWLDDILYLPEVLLLVMLIGIVAGGAGEYSLHRYLPWVLA